MRRIKILGIAALLLHGVGAVAEPKIIDGSKSAAWMILFSMFDLNGGRSIDAAEICALAGITSEQCTRVQLVTLRHNEPPLIYITGEGLRTIVTSEAQVPGACRFRPTGSALKSCTTAEGRLDCYIQSTPAGDREPEFLAGQNCITPLAADANGAGVVASSVFEKTR